MLFRLSLAADNVILALMAFNEQKLSYQSVNSILIVGISDRFHGKSNGKLKAVTVYCF